VMIRIVEDGQLGERQQVEKLMAERQGNRVIEINIVGASGSLGAKEVEKLRLHVRDIIHCFASAVAYYIVWGLDLRLPFCLCIIDLVCCLHTLGLGGLCTEAFGGESSPPFGRFFLRFIALGTLFLLGRWTIMCIFLTVSFRLVRYCLPRMGVAFRDRVERIERTLLLPMRYLLQNEWLDLRAKALSPQDMKQAHQLYDERFGFLHVPIPVHFSSDGYAHHLALACDFWTAQDGVDPSAGWNSERRDSQLFTWAMSLVVFHDLIRGHYSTWSALTKLGVALFRIVVTRKIWCNFTYRTHVSLFCNVERIRSEESQLSQYLRSCALHTVAEPTRARA